MIKYMLGSLNAFAGSIDLDSVVNVLDITLICLFVAAFVILIGAFIRGLFRGWRYGTYRLFMFALLFVVALFTLQPIVNLIGNLDLAQFGLGSSWSLPTFTVDLDGTSILITSDGTTAFTVVSGYIESLLTGLGSTLPPEALSAYALGFASSALSLALLFVDGILIAVFGTFFVFLLWHLLFKRFISKEKRKESYRKGKLWGGVSSVLVSSVCLCLIIFPLTSVVNSLNAAWKDAQLSEEDQTLLHTLDNDTYQMVDGVMTAYDNSLFAQGFFNWTANQDGRTLDTYLVDYLTNVTVGLGDQEKIQVSFLDELTSLAEVFTVFVQGGILSSDGFDAARVPLALTTAMAPEILRGLATSELVTAVMPYGLTILENIGPVSEYVKVGSGIDFSGDYELTFNELASLYDSVLDSSLLNHLVDPSTGELGVSQEVASDVLSEENVTTVRGIFASLDKEEMRIFSALIESALTIQAYNALSKLASEGENGISLTIADFLPAVELSDFAPVDGKATAIPEEYASIRWGDVFADFFESLVSLVNVSPELYLAVCNAIPNFDGTATPVDYGTFLEPILDDFDAAKAALVGEEKAPSEVEKEAGEAAEEEVTPLLGTSFLLNAAPKLVLMLGSSINTGLDLPAENAVDLSEVASSFREEQSLILPEFSALLDVVGDFATTEEGKEFLLHLEHLPGIYFDPEGHFVGISEGLVDGLVEGVRGLDRSLICTEVMPAAFAGFLEGNDSLASVLGDDIEFDFEVPNLGNEFASLLTTINDAQGLLAYLLSLGEERLTGQALKETVKAVESYEDELVGFLQAVAKSPILNPTVEGKANSNLAAMISMLFETIGFAEPSDLAPLLHGLSPSETEAEMAAFVSVLFDVMDSGIVPVLAAGSATLQDFASVSFSAMFASFDESIIFASSFGSVLDSLLGEQPTFAMMIEDGLSFSNVGDWSKEGENIDLLVSSIAELGADGLLSGGSIDLFGSDPGAVENILRCLSSSELFVSENEDGSYDFSFPTFVSSMLEDYLTPDSPAASFFKVPGGEGATVIKEDIASTAVSNGSREEVSSAQELWGKEAATLADIISDLAGLGGLEVLSDEGIDLAFLDPHFIDLAVHDASSLLVFGRVINYSLYSLLAEQLTSYFPEAAGSANLAPFYQADLPSYQAVLTAPDNVYAAEADVLASLSHAILDPYSGLIEVDPATGEKSLVLDEIAIDEVSVHGLAAPLLDSLSSSRLFNSLGEAEATSYEYILSSMLEKNVYEAGKGLENVMAVRAGSTDFDEIRARWSVENDALLLTFEMAQAADIEFDQILDDPFRYFNEGASHEGQRVRLENVLVASRDSAILRPAFVDLIEKAAVSLRDDYEVNTEWLLSASPSEYEEEVRNLSYVLLYGSFEDDFTIEEIDLFLSNPATEKLLRKAAVSHVFNSLPANATSPYTAFEQVIADSLDQSDLYRIEGEERADEREDARLLRVFERIDGADDERKDDHERFRLWETEIDSLMDIVSTLDATGIALDELGDFSALFTGEEAADEANRVKLTMLLDASGESDLVYPSIPLKLEAAVSGLDSGSFDLSGANFHYVGRDEALPELPLAPYSHLENERLAKVAMYGSSFAGSSFDSLVGVSGKAAGSLLAAMSTSAVFNSSEGSSTTVFQSAMAAILAEGFLADYFYSPDNPVDAPYLEAVDPAREKALALSSSYFPEVSDDSIPDSAYANLGFLIILDESGEVVDHPIGSPLTSLAEIVDYLGEGDNEGHLSSFADGKLVDDGGTFLKTLLNKLDASPLLKDSVPNSVGKMTASGFDFTGIDFSQSDPYWTFDASSGDSSSYGSEEIASLVDVLYEADGMEETFNLLTSETGLVIEDIRSIRSLLVSLASSKVFNGDVGVSSLPARPTIEDPGRPGTYVGTPDTLTVFQQLLFYFLFDSALANRAYDPVVDGEKGFASPSAKLEAAILSSTPDEASSIEEVNDLIADEYFSGHGLLMVAFEELGTVDEDGVKSFRVDFSSGEDGVKFETLPPETLRKIMKAANEVDSAQGMIANGIEYLTSDTVDLAKWSRETLDASSLTESGVFRLVSLTRGSGTLPTSDEALYYRDGGSYSKALPDASGKYSFLRSEDEADGLGLSTLIGPTRLYYRDDSGSYLPLFGEGGPDLTGMKVEIELGLPHLLAQEDYALEGGTIDSIVDFFGANLWNEAAGEYDSIPSATEFLDEGADSSSYRIVSFLLSPSGLYSAAFDDAGSFLGLDSLSPDGVPESGISFTSGVVLLRNFLQIVTTTENPLPGGEEVTIDLDLSKLFLDSDGSPENERRLYETIFSSLYGEANYAGDDRASVYPGGLSYFDDNFGAVISPLVYLELASNPDFGSLAVYALNALGEEVAMPSAWAAIDNAASSMDRLLQAAPSAEGLTSTSFYNLMLTSYLHQMVSGLLASFEAGGFGNAPLAVAYETLTPPVRFMSAAGLDSLRGRDERFSAFLDGYDAAALAAFRAGEPSFLIENGLDYLSDPSFYADLFSATASLSVYAHSSLPALLPSPERPLGSEAASLGALGLGEPTGFKGLILASFFEGYFYENAVSYLFLHDAHVPSAEGVTYLSLLGASLSDLGTEVDLPAFDGYFGERGYYASLSSILMNGYR